MNFDDPITRLGMNSTKWDGAPDFFGPDAKGALPMWVADMDFAAPDFLQDAVKGLMGNAYYGYFHKRDAALEASAQWMQDRHGWSVDPANSFSTFGLGNALALLMQAMTDPGDHVAIFSPVYHEFAAKIRKGKRNVTEFPLQIVDGIYRMDFERYETLLTGREKMVLFCSPHNPAGRVWEQDELNELAAFCDKHDLILVSDEIHHDLVFPGTTHLPTATAIPQISDKLVMLTSASKTFNVAGTRLGAVTIPDATLRARFADYYKMMEIQPNLLGYVLTIAAYSKAGAAWVDQLNPYLSENFAVFSEGVNAIPGVTVMPQASTYLAWVDFEGTGMSQSEFSDRVLKKAGIVTTPGAGLGIGGENFLRFNLGTQRARVEDAVARLQGAFADLQ
ncbi:MalY/PatB family protein [Actibacterium pelagium]|uniref:Aminotransferase n=1 Tax=Actibacterium pelagium TaxID=2029103 RepID=A0A917AFE8_9RHOB|nr:PatB family C-S lyase [Actibacterium pelagium]GGE49510.1 aminotransferase [Actibacterium pelagium]